MTKPVRRDLLLLAGKFNADKHDPVGMLMSEKLDGSRCWWDGGITRGVATVDVPWANIFDKDGVTLKKKIKEFASGLWTRYGNPMQAPEWFLDELPKGESLDGEMYAGHGNFQYVQKATRRDVPQDEQWEGIAFHVFGCPTYAQVLQDGLIKLSGNVTYTREIDQSTCLQFVACASMPGASGGEHLARLDSLRLAPSLPFADELERVKAICEANDSGLCVPVRHTVCQSSDEVLRLAKEVDEAGGEGMMLRELDSIWFPKRRNFILKVKPRHDSEATVVGFVAGRQGKTGLLLGKLGTIVVDWYGDETATCGVLDEPIRFELGTGLTFADRLLELGDRMFATDHPGKAMPLCRRTPTFKLGDRVTFSYRELSDDGVPKEGSYMRIRDDV